MALDLVAPLIPSGQDSKGPELFMHSLGQGLAAVARMNELKRNSEMEALKIAEHERVSQEEHALQREKMVADADYRDKYLEIQKPLIKANAYYHTQMGDFYKNDKIRTTNNLVAFNQQKEALVNDVNKDAIELNLNNPKFATEQPVMYAANVLKFKDRYGLSPLDDVQKAIKAFQFEADKQKIGLKMTVGPDGEATGEAKQVPIWQVVQKLQDPEQKDSMTSILKANGHLLETSKKVPGTPTKSWSRPFDSAWDSLFGPTDKTVIEERPSEDLRRIKAQGEGVKFERERSRVPAAMLQRSDAKGTSPTQMPQDQSLPDPDLPPVDPQSSAKPISFEPSDTDKIIMQAKAAIAKGAPQNAVAARLQEMGISSDALMG